MKNRFLRSGRARSVSMAAIRRSATSVRETLLRSVMAGAVLRGGLGLSQCLAVTLKIDAAEPFSTLRYPADESKTERNLGTSRRARRPGP